MKKKIPLHVLETIEPFVNKKGVYFDAINPENFLLKFIDKDNSSDFYFNVETFKNDKGFELLVDWKPYNKQNITNKKSWIKEEQLKSFFSNWLTILEGYDKVKSVYDDPIIEAYAEEYYSEFEIIDEDADIYPFSTKQVLLLDKHLDNIRKRIEKYELAENNEEINKIKVEVDELRENLTKKSKKWVIKKLTRIWAEITKQSPKLMKELLSEAKKLAIKEGLKYLIDKSIETINQKTVMKKD